MDKIGEEQKETVKIHAANKLPVEIMGRFLQNLSVEDCLKTERVSPLWKRALSKWGWTEQRKLDASIVFEGATAEEIAQFWETLGDDGECQLVSLLNCIGPWLRELDLGSFGGEGFEEGYIERFLQQIVESFITLKKLEKLDIRGLRLQDFVDHLPSTLHEITTSNEIGIETLHALSNCCPNLEEVPFGNLENKFDLFLSESDTLALIEIIGKFPRQKKLNLFGFALRSSEKKGALASFGQLQALEQLNLWNCVSLDGESLRAIVQGCPLLRSFQFNTHQLTERELLQLAKMANLTVIRVGDRSGGTFSDTVLKAIAMRGQLKKLSLSGFDSNRYPFESFESLTDDSILYLVDRCKSLVYLSVWWFPQITDRSLDAVVAEVRRRHGTVPGTLPSDDEDPGMFYFGSYLTGIDDGRARELIAGNPWLRFNDSDSREII